MITCLIFTVESINVLIIKHKEMPMPCINDPLISMFRQVLDLCCIMVVVSLAVGDYSPR